jgi:hypothetical protein
MKEQFVVYENPITHRKNVGSSITIQFDDQPTEVISIAESDWLCDFCNNQIKVFDVEENQLNVFVLNNSNALCMDCYFNVIKKDKSLNNEYGICRCCMDKEVTDNHRIVFRNREGVQLNGTWQGFMRFKSKYQLAEYLNKYHETTGELVIHDKLNKGKFEKAIAKAEEE